MQILQKPKRSALARLTAGFTRLLFFWIVGVLLLWQQWTDWPYATHWLILTSLVSVYLLIITSWHLPEHQKEGNILPHLGLANHITLLRGWSIACVAGFILAPQPVGLLAWVPSILFAVMSLTDVIDGYVARKTGYDTALGARLDLEMDGLGVLVVCCLGVRWGQLPIWYLPIGLLMYWFFVSMWWRKQRGQIVYELPPSAHRRLIAGIEMGFLAVMLWPIAPSSLTTTAGLVFAIPITLSFLRDWLFVSGRLTSENARYQQIHRPLYVWMSQYLPPFLRLTAVVSASFLLWQANSGGWFWAWMMIFVMGVFCVGLGILPRLWSIILMLPIAIHTTLFEITLWHHLLVASLLAIIILGGGIISLWAKEERFLMKRPGMI